jgi:hypothetical protein
MKYVGVGMMIMVHDNTQLPLVDLVGIQLAPGRKYRLGYYKKTNSFLPSPYTTCSDKVTLGMQAMFNQFSNADYSYAESSEIQANYIAVDVVCESTQVESYTQQPTIDAIALLSNVGGQTRLWIGISFLSLVEVAEMLYRLIRYQYHRIRVKYAKQQRNT